MLLFLGEFRSGRAIFLGNRIRIVIFMGSKIQIMKKILSIIAAALTGMAPAVQGQTPQFVPLYPDGAQESNGVAPEEVKNAPEFLTMAVDADYMLVLPDEDKATGQAVVICPGGGYAGVSYAHEGIDVARWFRDRGIAALVLRYRMPNGHSDIPLKDARTAIEMMRRNARQWHIDPEQVGIMGFSAGGHLASTAATHFTDESSRPDFSILIYPVVTLDERSTHLGTRQNLIGRDAPIEQVDLYSNNKQVNGDTPCAFIALSDDDKAVPPSNSLSYYEALKTFGIPAELHIYPSGGHGWGWRESFPYHKELTAALERWLGEIRKRDNAR